MLNNLTEYQKRDTLKFTVYMCGSTVRLFKRKVIQKVHSSRFGVKIWDFFPTCVKVNEICSQNLFVGWSELNNLGFWFAIVTDGVLYFTIGHSLKKELLKFCAVILYLKSISFVCVCFFCLTERQGYIKWFKLQPLVKRTLQYVHISHRYLEYSSREYFCRKVLL